LSTATSGYHTNAFFHPSWYFTDFHISGRGGKVVSHRCNNGNGTIQAERNENPAYDSTLFCQE